MSQTMEAYQRGYRRAMVHHIILLVQWEARCEVGTEERRILCAVIEEAQQNLDRFLIQSGLEPG